MCELDGGDGTLQASTTTWRKARKEHTCYSCRAKIVVGERYRYSSGIWEHEPYTEKCCAACDADLQAFGKDHNYYPSADSFEERLEECIAEGDEESETRWKPALERLRARRPEAATA